MATEEPKKDYFTPHMQVEQPVIVPAEQIAHFVHWWLGDEQRKLCILEQAAGAYVATFPGRAIPLIVSLFRKWKEMKMDAAVAGHLLKNYTIKHWDVCGINNESIPLMDRRCDCGAVEAILEVSAFVEKNK